MQIHRLFDIVYTLLERESVTASELARRLEVSTRTIYRDIDALSQAGIPVFADRGKHGGIRLMPGFTLSKSMLTEREQDEVLSALQGMRAASAPEADSALSKLSLLFGRDRAGWVSVDFSDWSGSDERFALLKQAILEKRRVRFDYYHSMGERNRRTVEPLQMWFRHRSWYLKAYCLMRQDYRVFKYVRMRDLELLDEHYTRELPETLDLGGGGNSPPQVCVRLALDASQGYRVYDEFDESQVQPQSDGSFLVTAWFIPDNWVLSFVLSFGEHACVIEPQWLRALIAWKLKKNLDQYV